MRRLAWPPSSPSARRPSWSRSKTTPRASRSRTAPGASSTSTCTADGRQSPRPAAIVSAAWRSGESPGSSAAARPPWAQKLALWESGVRETRQTLPPCSAARSAVQRPAAPPPTTATSNSERWGYRPSASRRIASSCSRSQVAAPSRARAFSSATVPLGLGGPAFGLLDPLLRRLRPGPRSRPGAPRPRRSPAPWPRARAAAPPRGRAAASRGPRSAPARSRSRSASSASISAAARRSASLATSAAAFSLRSASSTCALRLSPLGPPVSALIAGSI